MSEIFSEGADARWSPCPGMWILLWQEHRDTPAGGGFWGQCLCPNTHRHRSVPLCRCGLTQCHPLCLTCCPLNPPGTPPASPCPRTHPNTCRECWGASRDRNWADFKGTFGPGSLVGMASEGFARQRGAGILVGFVPGAKKMLLFPCTKGLVPQGQMSCGWMCGSGSWGLLEEGAEGAQPVSLGRGYLCRSPYGVSAYAEGLPDVGVPNPQSPLSSSSFLSPSSRFPQPGGPWLI